MITTLRRRTFAFTKRDIEILELLSQKLGENYSAVVRRALQYLYLTEIEKEDKSNER